MSAYGAPRFECTTEREGGKGTGRRSIRRWRRYRSGGVRGAIAVVGGGGAPTALGFFDLGSQPLRARLSCVAPLALSDERPVAR